MVFEWVYLSIEISPEKKDQPAESLILIRKPDPASPGLKDLFGHLGGFLSGVPWEFRGDSWCAWG
jgi:hypothetical protein